MGIQDIPTMPFDRFGCGYHAGEEFIDSPIHLYFNAEGYNDNPKFFNSEDDALLFIDIMRTAIKVAYDADPSDPVGALKRMCEAHYMADVAGQYFPGRDTAYDTGLVVETHKPRESQLANPPIVNGFDYSEVENDEKAPEWVRKICKNTEIPLADKRTAILTWMELLRGKYPEAIYRHETQLRHAFTWFKTPQGLVWWADINSKISNK